MIGETCPACGHVGHPTVSVGKFNPGGPLGYEAEAAKPPELCEWEQGWWSLSPTLRAERLALYGDELWENERRAYNKAPECGTCYCIAGFVVASHGQEALGLDVGFRAADLLGIEDDDDADRLFAENNTIEDVRRIAEEIAGERL